MLSRVQSREKIPEAEIQDELCQSDVNKLVDELVRQKICSVQVPFVETKSLSELQSELEKKETRLLDLQGKQHAYGGVPQEAIEFLKKSVENLQARIRQIN